MKADHVSKPALLKYAQSLESQLVQLQLSLDMSQRMLGLVLAGKPIATGVSKDELQAAPDVSLGRNADGTVYVYLTPSTPAPESSPSPPGAKEPSPESGSGDSRSGSAATIAPSS